MPPFWLYTNINVLTSVGRGFLSTDDPVYAVIKRILGGEKSGTCRVRKAEILEFAQIMSSENAMLELWVSYIVLIEVSSQAGHLTS